MDGRYEWVRARDELVRNIERLGFPAELGEEIAKNLGSPKAMERMNAYLFYVKPRSAELIVDEMLAICSDIESWRERKAAQEANARYNELLNNGFGIDIDEDEE
ncbi:MAG: hypothetical protein J5626_03225 [Lachnospiraceae bacterium]|nr:hypothetical protein [Lachnospiraceae bacterium]